MRSTICARALGCLFVTVLLANVVSFAANGRDFAGFYSVGNVTQQGELVQFTLNLQVFNYSAADVKQAVIKLHESGAGLTVHGTFQPIKLLANNRDVKLRQQFTVPLHEYERWQHGVQPSLFIVYQDAAGHRWERTIEVSSRPAPFPF